MRLRLVKLCADAFSTFFRFVERGRSILKKGEEEVVACTPPPHTHTPFSISALSQVFIPGWELCLIWCLPGCR